MSTRNHEDPAMTPAGLRPGVLAESPYFGDKTFGPLDIEAPWILRTGLAVTAEMIITVLYCDRTLNETELADDCSVWMHAAIELTARGTERTGTLARLIREREDDGTLTDPEGLAFCRRRVAGILGPAWHAAPCRCPCGYATADVAAFADHIDPRRRRRTDHHLVTGPQTLAELWEQHPTAARGD